MTEVNVEMLQKENDNLKAQLEASKAMYNDSTNLSFQLRTSFNIFQKQFNELLQKSGQQEGQIKALEAKLAEKDVESVAA